MQAIKMYLSKLIYPTPLLPRCKQSNISSALVLALLLTACGDGSDIPEASDSPLTVFVGAETEVVTNQTEMEAILSQVELGEANPLIGGESNEQTGESTTVDESTDVGESTTVDESTEVGESTNVDESPSASETVGFSLLSINIENITETSAVISWSLSQNATGKVVFGNSDQFGQETIEETSFRFSEHRQSVNNLGSGTTYYYYATSTNMEGQTVVSETRSFTTLGTAASASGSGQTPIDPASLQPVADWPAGANDDLPMAGIFYGQQEAGLVTGNSAIGVELSRRFRAEKTGYINAVRYNNRTLLDANVTGRCLPSAPDSVWCRCKNAGLDKYTCGYTLGNSYSVGNGGSIIIDIREDDGTEDHFPVSAALGRTAGIFVPVDRSDEHYPILELESPVFLQAGRVYHLVYRNINPPTSCGISGHSLSEAANCPRDQGAIGLNGTYQPVLFGDSKIFGPFGGQTSATLTKSTQNSGWAVDSDKLSWYEVRYDDNTWVGDSHTGIGSTAEGRQFVGGNTKVRQIFTVEDSSRTVDGLWLYFGHNYTYTPDGSNLNATLKDSSGTVLATTSIAPSPECISTAASGYAQNSFREQHCRVWSYSNLSTTVDLMEGQNYSIEFSSSDTAGFSLHTFFPLNYNRFNSTNRNFWNNAKAQVSTNGGNAWEDWAGTYYPDRDITMLFTIDGMPKQLQ